MKRLLRFVLSLIDPGTYLHILRLLHFYHYSHVYPRRTLHVGHGVHLAPNVSLRSGERISIGHGAHIGERSILWAGRGSGHIRIGDFALFGPHCVVTAANYDFDAGQPVMHQTRIEENVEIGSDVWLGAYVIVLPGVTIGEGTVVAAGSVVTRSLPPRVIAAGVPARVLRERSASAFIGPPVESAG